MEALAYHKIDMLIYGKNGFLKFADKLFKGISFRLRHDLNYYFSLKQHLFVLEKYNPSNPEHYYILKQSDEKQQENNKKEISNESRDPIDKQERVDNLRTTVH